MLKNILRIATGTLLGQTIVFLSSLLLTRLYSPESFGTLGTYQSIVSTIWIFATLRYDLGVALIKDDKKQKEIFIGTIFLIALFFSATTILYISIEFLNINFFSLKKYALLIPLGALALSLYFTFDFYLTSKSQFKSVSIAKTTQAFSMSTIQVMGGYLGHTALGLIAGYIIGYFVASLVLLRSITQYFPVQWANYLDKKSISTIKLTLLEHKQFPLFSLPSSFANIGSFQIPIILTAIVFSPEMAGFFFLAQRIIGLPIDVLTNSISQVFLGETSTLIHKEPHRVMKIFIKVITILSFIGFLPSLILWFNGVEIVTLIFGKDWYFSGKLIECLSLMYFTRLITTPISQSLNILNKLKAQFIWDITRFLLIVLLYLYAWQYSISMELFTIYYSLLMSLLYLLHSLLSFYYLKSHISNFR